MPLTPARVLRTPRYAVIHDGVDDRSVIEPFTVYGWAEITIEEWIYFVHPKASVGVVHYNVIGDNFVDRPSTLLVSDRLDYRYVACTMITKRPDGTSAVYEYLIHVPTVSNKQVHIIRRLTVGREYTVWVDGIRRYTATIPANEKTVLEWNPDEATYPERYRRFVIGANMISTAWMTLRQGLLRIYRRGLSDDQIAWNYNNPDDPVSGELRVSLYAHPDYIQDIDGDGIPEWIDLSGNGNHGKIYGARLVELVKEPARVLPPTRVLAPAR